MAFATADTWLDPQEIHDREVAESGIDTDEPLAEVEDDDYNDLFPPPGMTTKLTYHQRAGIQIPNIYKRL